jgi:uncharacterized membrane protein
MVVVLAVLTWIDHPLWESIFTFTAAHLIAGKAASILQGNNAGMPPWLIICIATYVDIVSLLLMYPVLIFSYQNFFEDVFFQTHMKRVFTSAERGMSRFGKFKVAGIFLFVLIPVWMTGIIIGAVLGYLMGLRLWIILTTVSLGSFVSVTIWVTFYEMLLLWFEGIQKWITGPAIAAFVVLLIAYRITKKRRAMKGGGSADLRKPVP